MYAQVKPVELAAVRDQALLKGPTEKNLDGHKREMIDVVTEQVDVMGTAPRRADAS